MSNEVERRPAILRFVDSFFEERNIKWMLGIGVLILFGSSVMLVTSRWDTYAPVWKHLILLTYTLAVFSAAEFSYGRLSLWRTGTVLKSLTVLLLPINFLALDRIWTDSNSGLLDIGIHIGLMGLTCAVSTVAARRIFRHFLRGDQPTFVICYLVMCVAGAVAPSLPQAWAPVIALFLWAVFTIGTVKVNRHVFWLTEEHRLPRVFGFFPIALLGTQFLTLMWTANLTAEIPLQWMGLAAVLVSVPILLTSDAVARVFQQRTGNLTRPIPWSIMLPLLTGLLLCATGVCLAGSGMPRPYALVPTAALAAAMMVVVARRTGHVAFVWSALLCALLAYNFSPVFFLNFARMVVQQGAAAVNEQRLPYAFYGLTYFPLLFGTTLISMYCRRRGNLLFAGPLKSFSIGVSSFLLAASLTHPKAIFPVAAVLMLIFALQTIAFRTRRWVALAACSFLIAAFGLTEFAAGVLELLVPQDMLFQSLSIAAGFLLFPGRLIDRWTANMERAWKVGDGDASGKNAGVGICQLFSLAATLSTAVVWVIWLATERFPSLPSASGAMLGLMLVLHSLVWLRPILGEAALCFLGINVVIHLFDQQLDRTTVLSVMNLGLLLGWFVSQGLQAWPHLRITRAFGMPLQNVSVISLALLMQFYLFGLAIYTAGGTGVLSWICVALTIVWTFVAARRLSSMNLTMLGCLGVFALESGFLTNVYGMVLIHQWLPAVWTATAVLGIPFSALMQARLKRAVNCESEWAGLSGYRALATPLNMFTVSIPIVAALISLTVFTFPLRVAGAFATAGLLMSASLRRSSKMWSVSLVLINWQLLCCVVTLFAPELKTLIALNLQNGLVASLPIAACAAISLLLIESTLFQRETNVLPGVEPSIDEFWIARVCELHRSLLRILIGAGLLVSLHLAVDGASSFQMASAATAFVGLVTCELLAACRIKSVERAWMAQALAAAAIGYFVWMGAIVLSSSVAMFGVLFIAFAAWSTGRLTRSLPTTRILSEPLTTSGLALPMLAIGLAVHRHLQLVQADWLGTNSLALLLVAGFYFWVGTERRLKSLIILSAGILNIALALLWRELAWHDPQFFMIPLGISVLAIVQFLRREIPEAMRDPLTYLGALTILVSPTFHIVGGSWLHLLMLMVLSVGITLVSIGLRVRALMYTGTAFLVADLVAMICRGGIDYPHLLWVGGIALGAAVVMLAAICERYRETLLQRIRVLAAGLETWQ